MLITFTFVVLLYGSHSYSQKISKATAMSSSNKIANQEQPIEKETEPKKETVIFLGDSLTLGGQWHKSFTKAKTINHGIEGNTTLDILNRIDAITQTKPEKLFLLIGVNDLWRNVSQDDILENYTSILSKIKTASPQTKIYIQSMLPVNTSLQELPEGISNDILGINEEIKSIAKSEGATFIDLYPALADEEGSLPEEYTLDGVHINEKAYSKWIKVIEPYVNE